MTTTDFSTEAGLESGEDQPLTGPGSEGVETFDCRQTFADTLIELARADERIVAVCNDSVGSSNLTAFRDEFPDRLINVGIAEQDMVGVGAGLASSGLVPFVCAGSAGTTTGSPAIARIQDRSSTEWCVGPSSP